MGRLNNDMYACGRKGLPDVIFCAQQRWRLDYLFKHDFFACTGLYACNATGRRCVLKMGRLQSFLGIPLAWLGRFLRNRELNILQQLNDIEQTPNLLATFGRNGLIYEYIEGQSLDEKPELTDDFFVKLDQLLETIHARNVCYMDLNKHGNILVGKDGRPYLIDFQISLFLPGNFCSRLRRLLQREDGYHVLKHKRRFRPDLLEKGEYARSKRPSILIRLHRLIAVPFRTVRRQTLRFLYRKHILNAHSKTLPTPENDHRRFL